MPGTPPATPIDQRRTQYPPFEPYDSGMLKVSDLHTLYYEQSGNPNGKPVVYLHGGPGGGSEPYMRQFFNPEKYRVILFDQRGCGRSTPYADLTDNTTWHLVDDIEKIREHLKIEKWQVFGGSWGSTLALAYAEKHPERVTELVLRGIFMCRRSELEWYYQNGASHIYPERFAAYRDFIPENERHDMIAAYYKRLTGDDEEIKLEAAKRWSTWETGTSHLINSDEETTKGQDPVFALPFARIESHYFINGAFLEPDQLLKNIEKIRHIPGTIAQGRYDVICPVRSAWDLHQAWPESTLHIIPDAGHSSMEEGIVDALVRATDAYSEI